MTEQEWLTGRDHPQSMVLHLRGTSVTRTKVGRRKLRLFACGCCRLIWPQLEDSRLRDTVEVAERFAEGNATATELGSAGSVAQTTIARSSYGFSHNDPDAQVNTAVAMVVSTTHTKPFSTALYMTMYPFPLAGYCGSSAAANRIICDLLRDVFGNPFRPVTLAPEWRTGTVVSLARGMYESRDFGAMPILADALQDAGCDSDDVLAHCRDPQQVHVRGCWVVDRVLGKG